MNMLQENQESPARTVKRVRLWYAVLLLIFGIFTIRLFYLQIIKHGDYAQQARQDQTREYEVDADRGTIYAQMSGKTVPLVVNQKLFTVYADPSIIKKPEETAAKLAKVLSVSEADILELLKLKDRRYVILEKKVGADVSKRVLGLKIPGVGTQERNYRAYPHGSLASQLLGFVNDEGKGEYGLEQALNKELAGTKGQLKAVTDVHGIPLAASSGNLLVSPSPGRDVTLTIDMGMQLQVEQILKKAQEANKSKKVGAIVLETDTGAVKAMANYPTFDPANYQKVEDGSVFQNATVTEPIEPGSIVKILSVAAGLDSGAITPQSSYHDNGSWLIDSFRVTNVAEAGGNGTKTTLDILNHSLNTGATWVLMRMGGDGNKINAKGREALFDYYTNHYMLGKETGIEQGYEGTGYLVGPKDKDNGINITYANMAFGQGFSASALQMVSAMAAIVNGGTYYQPHLVASMTNEDGSVKKKDPIAVKKDVVSDKTSQQMRELLMGVTEGHRQFAYMRFPDGYEVGGKTGTAEVVKPGGGYYDNLFSGTFMGYVGGDKPQYAIIVYNIEPTSYPGRHAGTGAGQPVFAEIAHMLIDKYGVTPKQ